MGVKEFIQHRGKTNLNRGDRNAPRYYNFEGEFPRRRPDGNYQRRLPFSTVTTWEGAAG